MTSHNRKHYETLIRRRDWLKLRLGPDFIGNPEPTKRELSAMQWAIAIIDELERQDLLKEVTPLWTRR